MNLAHGVTTIGRLRIRTDRADPAAHGMRSASALRSLDLQPPSMPPQAILCIRAMRDPLPGGVDLRSSHSPRPEMWERAARAEIASIMRRAVRPALGPVPSEAEAVLFADRSELLACALRAADEGLLETQWWWTHLVEARSSRGVVREWQQTPLYVPAAVELLARIARIEAVSHILTPSETLPLIESMLSAYALDSAAREVSRAFADRLPATRSGPEMTPDAITARPPWHSIASEAERGASAIEHRVLVALALVLRRRPALARSAAFVRQVAEWIALPRVDPAHRETGVHAIVEPHCELEPAKRAAPEQPLVAADVSPPDDAKPVAPSTRRGAGTRASTRPETSNEEVAQTRPADRTIDGRWQSEAVTASTDQPRSIESSSDNVPPSQRAFDEQPTQNHGEALPALLPDLVIHSEYAGLFFLLNVFIALGLYSDFTSPVQRGIDCDLWQFLRLISRALSGEDLEDDAIWPFLQSLADDDAEAPDEEWLAGVVEQIRLRLARGLNLPPEEVGAFVIKRFARITTSPAHLDIHFSLAAHPIEIRMSGLDRDPGWMPAAGRHVTFYFE